MKLSGKVQCGLRALFDLAQRYGEGPIQSREIAQRQGISEAYLHQVLIAMRRGGLVRSLRGPQGGHALARPPAEISFYDVLTTLDGATEPAFINDGVDQLDDVVLRDAWTSLSLELEDVLKKQNLADLCDMKKRRAAAITFQI